MSRLVTVGRTAGVVGTWLGVATAGAAVGFAAERYAMGRSLRRDDPHAGELFGSVRGQARTVATDDGATLHAEVDEPAGDAGLTIVFSHGFALTQDSWHFQRRELRGHVRMVFWDQRGHGRSGSNPDDTTVSFERLATDLGMVIDATVPDGPIVLAGHSMGGMTVMALARVRPDLFAGRIVGAALIATSAQKITLGNLGLPGYLGRLAGRAAPGAVSMLARRPDLVEQSRRMGSDLTYVLTRRYAFASGSSPALVEFTTAMNAMAPIGVVAALFPLFGELDASDVLPIFAGFPVVVIAAEKDNLTPVRHGRDLAEALPYGEYVEAADTGHMVLLERPELVTEGLFALLERIRRGTARPRQTKTKVTTARPRATRRRTSDR